MMTPGTLVIAVRDLTYHFGERRAVDHLSLDIRAGEVFGLLGHNGAGKTTTVRLLNGLLKPGEGHIQVLGFNPTIQGASLRRYTGVLTETPALEEQLTARDNLRIYASLYNVARTQITRRVECLLHTFDLAEHAGMYVRGYSKGMKQRLALARALLHEPQIIFLDEPTEGLDPVAAHSVRELIIKLSREEQRTVVLCTHNLQEAQQCCDRIAVMQQGCLQTLGTPHELKQQVASNLLSRLDIEVAPHALAKVRATIEAAGIKDYSVTGNTLTIQDICHEMIPALIERFVDDKIPIYKVMPYEPSMEDVYFALHKKAE